MSCARSTSLALFVCCSVASLAPGEAAAQAMTPLRVDPVLLGLPPVEKKAPAPAKPAEPAADERVRAEVKPVAPTPVVEAKPLATEADSVPAASQPQQAEAPRPAKPAAPDQIPARAVAPAEVAAPVVAAPSPVPAPAQSSSPVVAAPAPRPREQEEATPPAAAKSVAAAGPAPAPVPIPSSGGKVSTLEPLRVHPGLLGLPVLAGTPASAAGGARAASPATPPSPSSYAQPVTMASLDKGRNDAWRAGRPPVLNFNSEALELPDGATPALALRKVQTMEPLQAGGGPMPMFLTADDLSGVTDHETVANGDAEARRAGTVVNADRMTYWPVEDELDAVGNVKLAKGEDYVAGPHMRMKMADQTGFFDQPDYFFKRESTFAAAERKKQEKGAKGSTVVAAAGSVGNVKKIQMSRPEEGSLMNVLGVSSDEPEPLPLTESRGKAERIDFEGENKLRIIKGDYTTCKPGDTGWYLKTDELALDYDRSVGEGTNATLYFQNTPIFYSPWLSFSLNNERKSGFLHPTFGSSSVNGLSLTTPYYWNIAPNMDATIAPTVYGKRGTQVASEYRYRDYNFAGDIRGSYLPNDRLSSGDDRYAYSVRHQQNLGYGFAGNLNIAGVSDDKYFTDLSSQSILTSQRQLLREGTLAYGGEWWSANVKGQSYQTLNPDPAQPINKPYSLAPQVNVTARRPDFYQTDLAFVGQYTSFTHATWDQGQRTVAYPSVSMPIVQPGWYVTPKVGANVTSYSLDRRAVSADCSSTYCSGTAGKSSISRSLPIFSVDSGMTFERDTSWFGAKATQTLEPRLYYLYVPYKDQSNIPVFDSALADFNFAQIFSENQFSGYDRISDANQLTAAVTTRLIDPSSGAEAMRAMFGQRYYFQKQRVTLQGVVDPTTENDKWKKSDFLAAFSGRVLPKTYLDTALQYSLRDARMDRSSIGARYQPELGKVLNVSYRYGSEQTSAAEFKNVDVAGQWPIWGGWSAVGRYNYSFLDHKAVETVGGLEYSAGCWAVRMVGHQVATTTGRSNTTLFVQLELNDFARIGSNPIDLLRRNIQGYGLANQSVADPVFGD